jgi:hypothetical protein
MLVELKQMIYKVAANDAENTRETALPSANAIKARQIEKGIPKNPNFYLQTKVFACLMSHICRI